MRYLAENMGWVVGVEGMTPCYSRNCGNSHPSYFPVFRIPDLKPPTTYQGFYQPMTSPLALNQHASHYEVGA
jgi:hypothetical protein